NDRTSGVFGGMHVSHSVVHPSTILQNWLPHTWKLPSGMQPPHSCASPGWHGPSYAAQVAAPPAPPAPPASSQPPEPPEPPEPREPLLPEPDVTVVVQPATASAAAKEAEAVRRRRVVARWLMAAAPGKRRAVA